MVREYFGVLTLCVVEQVVQYTSFSLNIYYIVIVITLICAYKYNGWLRSCYFNPLYLRSIV